MSVEHTRTPWKLIPAKSNYLYGPDTQGIAIIGGESRGPDVDHANAAFILRAVNSYDAHTKLVTAAAQIFAGGGLPQQGEPVVVILRKSYDALQAALAMASIEGGL